MTEATFEAMQAWLEENPEVRAEMCREINSYDGSMDFADVFDSIEDAIAELGIDAVEAARMTFFGDVDNWFNAVRIDIYGNFTDAGPDAQEYIEEESAEYINEIIDFIDTHGFDEFGYVNDISELEEIYLQDSGEDEEY
jgi:hypothetical protein